MKVTDKQLQAKIDEFGELSDEISRVQEELKALQTKYKSIDKDLTPLLEELKEAEGIALQTDKYLVSIKTAGYERESKKYKQAFDLALTKVNKATQKILEQSLESTTTISKIATKIGVQKLSEASLSDYISKIKKFITTKISSISKSNAEMKSASQIISKLSKLI